MYRALHTESYDDDNVYMKLL